MTKSSRQALTTARRWVIKIGSAILTDNGQGVSHDFIARLASDVIALREEGLDDGQILEANQIICYFNYVNRSLNGLGVTTKGDIVGFYAD